METAKRYYLDPTVQLENTARAVALLRPDSSVNTAHTDEEKSYATILTSETENRIQPSLYYPGDSLKTFVANCSFVSVVRHPMEDF